MDNLESDKILVVDDEPDLRELLVYDFESEGYKCFQAESATSALRVLQETDARVIISDIRMPDGDGVTLLKNIRELKLERGIILILVSGFSDLSVREAFDLGADGFLLKPFNRRQLMATVKNLLLPEAERWASSTEEYPLTYTAQFDSVEEAENSKALALGRGGLYFLSQFKPPEANQRISFSISFMDGPLNKIRGQGIVRWKHDNDIGLEFTYIVPEDLPSLLEFLRDRKPVAFIPKE